jgi:hypothetical protein
MIRREFIKGIFIVGAAAAVPTIVLASVAPDFSEKIGKITWNTEWVSDKSCYIHTAGCEMLGENWIAPEYSNEGQITPELERKMIKALQKRWILLHDA